MRKATTTQTRPVGSGPAVCFVTVTVHRTKRGGSPVVAEHFSVPRSAAMFQARGRPKSGEGNGLSRAGHTEPPTLPLNPHPATTLLIYVRPSMTMTSHFGTPLRPSTRMPPPPKRLSTLAR